MNATLQSTAVLIGRLALATIFIIEGVHKIGHFSDTAAHMASAGLPMVSVLLVLTILIGWLSTTWLAFEKSLGLTF